MELQLKNIHFPKKNISPARENNENSPKSAKWGYFFWKVVLEFWFGYRKCHLTYFRRFGGCFGKVYEDFQLQFHLSKWYSFLTSGSCNSSEAARLREKLCICLRVLNISHCRNSFQSSKYSSGQIIWVCWSRYISYSLTLYWVYEPKKS